MLLAVSLKNTLIGGAKFIHHYGLLECVQMCNWIVDEGLVHTFNFSTDKL